jgi:hypothetical protein
MSGTKIQREVSAPPSRRALARRGAADPTLPRRGRRDVGVLITLIEFYRFMFWPVTS